MTGLELELRRILSTYRQRYRVVSVPAADDEAVTAILAACGEHAKRVQRDAVREPERQTAAAATVGKARTPARRTGRPGASKQPRATTMTTSSTQPREPQ